EALLRSELLWVNVGTRPSFTKPLSNDLIQLNTIRERFLWVRFKNIAPLIHEMRRIKDPYEVDCLKIAFEIHKSAFEKIMKTLKPGENESLGVAIFDYETGSRGPDVTGRSLDAYESNIIVATGGNSAIPHYMDNNQDIKDGDLVLIDSGVDYKGYCSDITRTFPANGRFTDRQKEVYAIVLEAQKRAIETMKPGATARDAHFAVYETWKKHGLEKYGYGTCGHPVGLNIHDANGWRSDDDKPFEPGYVLVIEPLVMMPEEEIGIRIEDGVLITETGCELLAGPPREIEDVEALCSRG
ncbi:MAG: aminopeptidase P family protein, partial [Deltaproteobacteria bacterium]|nr:aminopeptidase P family protein [Deltaproteobacteria bacterium]